MRAIMNVLSGIVSVYMLLIFIRILLTWFSGVYFGRAYDFLRSITDPYLDWFRRFSLFRAGFFDFSPFAALAVLSILNGIFTTLAREGRISLGIVLAMILASLWQVVSFMLGFCMVILVLRLIAYLTGRNVYQSFWALVDAVARPILYRIQRILFRNRLVHYLAGLTGAILFLLALWILGGQLAGLAVFQLRRLPF